MKEVLIISPFVPYDKVPHAGGKIHNYYIKRLNKEPNLNIKLVTFASVEEINFIDLESYKVNYDISYYSDGSVSRDIKRIILNLNSKLNPIHKNGGVCSGFIKYHIRKKLHELKKLNYVPDVVVMEWTQIALLINEVKVKFPLSKIIILEHDVFYQRFFRMFENEKNILKKCIRKIKYLKLKSSELDALAAADAVFTLNYKDKSLLQESKLNIKKLDFICPYYDKMYDCEPTLKDKNLIFYGAMDRQENYDTCIWFIENVLYKLIKLDNEFKFYIVGNKPNKSLLKYKCENIVITGFVTDVKKYLEKSLCMVAPLVNGAGIKIKILEAMSAGCVILTNEIGIEGIPAVNGKHYIHCEKPNEYIDTIMCLSSGIYDLVGISQECKRFVQKNFDFDSSYKKYKEEIES